VQVPPQCPSLWLIRTTFGDTIGGGGTRSEGGGVDDDGIGENDGGGWWEGGGEANGVKGGSRVGGAVCTDGGVNGDPTWGGARVNGGRGDSVCAGGGDVDTMT